MSTILGLDLSTRTGLALVNSAGLFSFSTIIDISKFKSINIRFATFYKDLNILLITHKPELIIIEDIYFAANQKTFKLLAQLQALAILSAATNNIPFQLVNPTSARLAVLGSGKLKKEQVYEKLQILFPDIIFYDPGYNMSDALLLALYGKQL